MDIRDRQGLKAHARSCLAQAAYNPKKLMLLHTAVSLGIPLILTLCNFLLTRGIDTTGGLAGLQLRSVLSTIQQAVQLVGNIVLPFWQIGLVFSVLRLARQEQANPRSLLAGFRRFGPVLRLMLLKGLIFAGVAMACSYVSAGLFLLTPLASPFMDMLMPLVESADPMTQQLVLDEQMMAQAMPVVYIFGAVFLTVALPLFYRLRLAEFAIMDEPINARAAIAKSWKLTKKNCLSLLRLDLSFWWFYVLEGLLVLVCYLDVLLPLVGINLTQNGDLVFWTLYGAYLLGRLVLYWLVNAQVQTTYAMAYEALCAQPERPAPVPEQLPWDEV